MWKILKAEIVSYKYIIMSGFLYNIFGFMIYVIWGGWLEGYIQAAIMSIMAAATIIVILGTTAKRSKSSIVRFHVMLPVSQSKVYNVQLLIVSLFWIITICLFSIINMIKPRNEDIFSLWSIFFLNGSLLIMNSIISTIQNIGFCFTRKTKILFFYNDEISGMLLTVILMIITLLLTILLVGDISGQFGSLQKNVYTLFHSRYFVFFLNLAGFCLLYLSVFAFTRRRSYIR